MALGPEFSLQRSRQVGEGFTQPWGRQPEQGCSAHVLPAAPSLPVERSGSSRMRTIPCRHPWALPSLAELCQGASMEHMVCTRSNTAEEQK